MKIGLVGYGRMGKMIEAAAREEGHDIVSRIDPFSPDANHTEISPLALNDVDVVIEFSTPASVIANIEKIIKLGKPLVVGTTGWLGRLEEIRAMVDSAGGRLVYGANYSVGVNLFYKMVREAARIMNAFPFYDVAGFEAHHNQKTDSPSGTAKSLADILLSTIERKKRLEPNCLAERKIEPEELHFPSVRLGSVPGTHSIFFDSSADTIELTHRARNREGFARGAVMAAAWLLSGERKGLIPVEDMFADY